MRPDDFNGVALLLMMLLSLVCVLCFGKFRQKKILLFQRFLLSLPLGLFMNFAIVMPHLYSCDDSGNGPFNQGLISALCIVPIMVFVPRKIVIVIAIIILLLAGEKLGAQFKYLVNRTGDYTYANTYTGKPVNQACSDDPDAVHPKAIKRWHTGLTRIYTIAH